MPIRDQLRRFERELRSLDPMTISWIVGTAGLMVIASWFRSLYGLWTGIQIFASIPLVSFLVYANVRGWVIPPLRRFIQDVLGVEERRRGGMALNEDGEMVGWTYIVNRAAIPLIIAAAILFGEMVLLAIFFPILHIVLRVIIFLFGAAGLFVSYRYFFSFVIRVSEKERACLEREGKFWLFLERGWQYLVPYIEDVPESRVVNLARELWDTGDFQVTLGDGTTVKLDIQLAFLVPDLDEETALNPEGQAVYRFTYGYKPAGVAGAEVEEEGELRETFKKTAQAVARQFATGTRFDPLSDDASKAWIAENQADLSRAVEEALKRDLDDGQPGVLPAAGITLLEVTVKNIDFGPIADDLREREKQRIRVGTEKHVGEQEAARAEALAKVVEKSPEAVELDKFHQRQETLRKIATGPNNTVLGIDVDKVELDLRGQHSGPANAGQGGQQPPAATPSATTPPASGGGGAPKGGGGSRPNRGGGHK